MYEIIFYHDKKGEPYMCANKFNQKKPSHMCLVDLAAILGTPASLLHRDTYTSLLLAVSLLYRSDGYLFRKVPVTTVWHSLLFPLFIPPTK